MTSLPPTIDSTVAIRSFQSQRELMLNLIRHCLPSVTTSLWAKCIIPRDVRERAVNEIIETKERIIGLLDCIEARITVDPSSYHTVVDILDSEPFLELLAKRLIHNYGKVLS